MAERETARIAEIRKPRPLIGKTLPYKPRDSETADLQDLRNHAFLNNIPYSGSTKKQAILMEC